jgi:hypothetical protein
MPEPTDLDSLPEPGTFEEASQMLAAKVQEQRNAFDQLEQLQSFISRLGAEIAYYQGAAKALQPKPPEPNRETRRANGRATAKAARGA